MYKIKYTEQHNQKASEYETRGLLYLLAMRDDSEDISVFFIDCLNDVTGSTEDCNKLWDAQAKGVSSLNPTKIGEALITLFENYVDELDFMHSILILPKIKEGYLKDEGLKQYSFGNFSEDKKSYVINGLKKEYCKREKLESIPLDIESSIKEFLNNVLFVVGDDKEVYIKEIVQFRNKDTLSLSFYSSIFDEIRDRQSALKNQNIEGVQIDHPKELFQYNKHLKSTDIRLMVLNRFAGFELFKNNLIPPSYTGEIQGQNPQDIKDLMQENNSKLSRTFFNKNNKVSFWILLENITSVIKHNTDKDIRIIYNLLDEKLIKDNHTLDLNSVLFFISIIKDGINYDN